MIRTAIVSALLVASVPAVAGPTLTANLGGTVGTAASYSYNITTALNEPLTLTATSRKFFIPPGMLTNLDQTTAIGLVDRTATSIGVVGGANTQLDTNIPGTALNPQREALLITGSVKFAIRGLSLSVLDQNDTLRLFGVNGDGSLATIGFGTTINQTPANAGTVRGGLDGAAQLLSCVAESTTNSTCSFRVAPTGLYKSFLFTTRVGGDVQFGGDGGQGFRLNSITGALPEPGTWAMLIGGFGMAGAAMRRQRKVATA
jgi:PEP-CTERM motif